MRAKRSGKREKPDQLLPIEQCLDLLPVAAALYDRSGHLIHANSKAEQLWQGPPPAASNTGSASDELRLFNNKAAPLALHEIPWGQVLLDSAEVPETEVCFERNGGDRRCLQVSAEALRDPSNNPVGLIVCFHPMPSGVEANRQQVLMTDLQHRLKNLLATVQAIAALTLRSVPTLEEFRAAFEERLDALSQAHDALSEGAGPNIGLRRILDSQLAPYRSSNPGRIRLRGEDLQLDPQRAQALAMAVHELVTNAAKYGVLSRESGSLHVLWGVRRRRPTMAPVLSIRWMEQGEPSAAMGPIRRGVGLRMLEQGFGRQLGAATSIRFRPQGFTCRLDIPLPTPAEGV